MIGIHPVHRRLAELTEKAERHGGYLNLSEQEQMDLHHCLKVNARLVRRQYERYRARLNRVRSGESDAAARSYRPARGMKAPEEVVP